ncbi:MAG: hypothetical protein B7Z80_27000, partial [Rhodospirillales bacterium 20-64-7]
FIEQTLFGIINKISSEDQSGMKQLESVVSLLLGVMSLLLLWYGRNRAARGMTLWSVGYVIGIMCNTLPVDGTLGVVFLLMSDLFFVLARIGFYLMADSLVGTSFSARTRMLFHTAFIVFLTVGVAQPLVGTAMLIRRALFEKIGVLDDRIFAYWEDIDYSIRSALAGFRNVMVFDTSIYHPGKATIAAPDTVKPHYYYLMTRNEIMMWRSFCSPKQVLKAAFWVLRRQLRQIMRMPNNATGLDAMLSGLWDGLRGIGGGYDPKRRMPTPFRQLLARYPDLWLRILDAGH